ncbi:hypothetical protein HY967_04530 [Candidatus Jorgensenbacteria bacterium]|nr:hypothetical protein [Candidatus Jorgensenbacteria bacterium]
MFRDLIAHFVDLVIEFFRKEEVWWILIFVALAGLIALPPALGDITLRQVWLFILKLLVETWWLWFFFIIFFIARSSWLHWRQELFKKSTPFILLEIKIPREIAKSPQAMEQVLQTLYSLRNSAGDLEEKYWDGEVTRWFSLEMVSFGGEIRFYIRTYFKYRNLLEAAFFSYYPDVEIVEVEDYVEQLPHNVVEMQERGLELWGSEMVLAREPLYPIKSYSEFENIAEEKQFDPISTFIEVLGKIKREEFFGIHILISALEPNWGDKYRGSLDSLQTPQTTEISSGDEDEGTRQVTIARTPGQIDVLEAVERNLSKVAFNTLVRFVYLSPRESFFDSYARRGILSAFNQYGSLSLNTFVRNEAMSTRVRIWYWPHIAPKTRNVFRQARLLWSFRERAIPPEEWMGRWLNAYLFNWNLKSRWFPLNVECLATIFHPPTAVVLTAPHIKRVESRKAGPPAGLAIFGEEEDIEKFQ